jgi:hypothetical protein
LQPPADLALTKTMFLPGDEPEVKLRNVEAVRPVFEDDGNRTFNVEVDVGRLAVGRHSSPRGVEGTELKHVSGG